MSTSVAFAANRETIMVELYGEVCNITKASKILGKSAPTVKKLINSGKIKSACDKKMIDVRSIAQYICKDQ